MAVALGIDFCQRSTPLTASRFSPEIAVVFTGQFSRVEAGLALLETEQAGVLFISGVNRRAGIQPENFAEQFALSPVLRDAMADGRIILASDANTTLENAIEAACWVEQQDDSHPVVLVTDRFHMPRASLALERAVPQKFALTRVFPEQVLPVEEGIFHKQELFKFAATWGITLLPRALWPSNISSECE